MKIKKVYQKSFTTVDNTVLNDTSLSWKAKGLFVYLWSQADEWDFYETEVVKHSTDKIASLKSGLKELEQQGYLKRQRKRDDKGHLKENEWILFDNPMLENPMLDNPMLDNPMLENHTLTNTNNNNTNNNNNNINISINKESGSDEQINAFTAYQMTGASLTGRQQPILVDYVERLGHELVIHAIEYMEDHTNRPNFSYLRTILNCYEDNHITTVEDAIKNEERFREHRQKQQNKQTKKGNAAGYDAKQWTYLSEEEEMRRFFGDD